MTTAQIEVSEERSICQAVTEAIADAEETDPTELTPPLFDVIETEALDTLFAKKQVVGKVIFNYNRYEVSVYSDEYVSIKDRGS